MQFIQHKDFPNLFIREHSSEKYPPRTAINASSGDVTLALATDMNTRGEVLTKELVLKANKLYVGIPLTDELSSFDVARSLYSAFKKTGGNHLNIAGNSILTLEEAGCTQDWINEFVFASVEKLHQHWPLAKIVTGGQTGVDMAGAVAGVALGIHTEVTFPKGFLQRFNKSGDITQSPDDVFQQFATQIESLQKKMAVTPKKKMTP